MTMSTGSSESPIANPLSTAHRVRVIIFRVVATLAGLFFVVAVVLMASAPWVLLQPDQEVRRTGSLVPHRCRQRGRDHRRCAARPGSATARTLLVFELAGAVIVAGAIILPFQPTFAAILAIGVVPLIAYPYWRDVRMLHMPRLAGICRPNGPALD
jgi:hypothetical protein